MAKHGVRKTDTVPQTSEDLIWLHKDTERFKFQESGGLHDAQAEVFTTHQYPYKAERENEYLENLQHLKKKVAPSTGVSENSYSDDDLNPLTESIRVAPSSPRKESNPINFHQGMFALMASFDWDKGEFSPKPEHVALKNKAFKLLNLPPHLSTQFNAQSMNEFIESMQRTGVKKRDMRDKESPELVRRSTDYTRNLIKLSRTLHR